MDSNLKNVGKNILKKDSLSLSCGLPLFCDDYDFQNILHAKILYSPYPHCIIKNIDTSTAEKIKGVKCILTYKNVPDSVYSTSGQSFPEPSPYDSVILDKKMRFIGDKAAAVAAETEEAAEEALSLIKIDYGQLPYSLSTEESLKDNAAVIHDENYAKTLIDVNYEPSKNKVCSKTVNLGSAANSNLFNNCRNILEEEYSTHYVSHCMMEPHITITYFDNFRRLVIITATQAPFHVRRVISEILGIPIKNIRVIKPKTGGAFGGKQDLVLEPICSLLTLRTGLPVRLAYSRKEQFISARTRHPEKIYIKSGFDDSGIISDIEMKIILNSGAYGNHTFTVGCNSGSKTLPMFNKIKNIRFDMTGVYTNMPVAGAFRGYGAVQGFFAFGTHIDQIANKLGIDVIELYKKQLISKGESAELLKHISEGKQQDDYNVDSCILIDCINTGIKEIDWYNKLKHKDMRSTKTLKRGLGMAVMMQGSSIPYIDMSSAVIKMNEDGSFNILCGASDLGCGSDTVISQIAAETLSCSADDIIIYSSDTDMTTYDSGAFASSTTYLSGNAVKKTAESIKIQILNTASEMMCEPVSNFYISNSQVVSRISQKKVSYKDVGYYSFYTGNLKQICASESFMSKKSPPPFSVHFSEIEVDIETGKINVLEYVTVTDCGTVINPKLAECQIEGSVIIGLGFTLTEEYIFDKSGKVLNPNLGNYKIFTSMDIPKLKNIILNSYEDTGPFGAKSIGEVAVNGPAPVISNAIFNATGIRLYDTPFTSEKVFFHLKNKGRTELL